MPPVDRICKMTVGTTGQNRRMEALRVTLSGVGGGVEYCAHSKNLGWTGWARDGEVAGTTGENRRAEAIQVVLVPKGEPAPPADVMGASTNYPAPSRP